MGYWLDKEKELLARFGLEYALMCPEPNTVFRARFGAKQLYLTRSQEEYINRWQNFYFEMSRKYSKEIELSLEELLAQVNELCRREKAQENFLRISNGDTQSHDYAKSLYTAEDEYKKECLWHVLVCKRTNPEKMF